MLKTSEISRYSTPRTHRTYTAQFKAELVAPCGQPGVSIAALAGQHAMNANVLHRELKEHERSGYFPRSPARPVLTQGDVRLIILRDMINVQS